MRRGILVGPLLKSMLEERALLKRKCLQALIDAERRERGLSPISIDHIENDAQEINPYIRKVDAILTVVSAELSNAELVLQEVPVLIERGDCVAR